MEIFMTFVVPVLVLAAIGAVIAFCLSFLGEKMSVERDPRIDEIARNLSGANCGGCGYAGCDAFAEALFKGEAKLSACNPTSPANKKNIARILGMNEEDSKETVAVVHCIGGNACRNKFSYQGFGDCESAELLAGGNKACFTGCMGLGTCADACKYSAISVNKDTAVSEVDYTHCTSCGACVAACPKKIIGRIPKDAKVYVGCSNTNKGRAVAAVCDKGCIACGRCEKNCPTGAIQLSNSLAVIDYDKCIGCMKCVEVCPRKCILPFDFEAHARTKQRKKPTDDAARPDGGADSRKAG